MRLICPNCDAQYEVPSEVIPEEGRDVQCSNCGQTWYQHHPDHMPEETAEADAVPSETLPETPEHHDEDIAEAPSDEVEDSARHDAVEDSAPDDVAFENEEHLAPDTPAEQTHPAAAFRRELDPTIADVLRAEAEREAEARRKEGATLMESQPDLGLPDPSDDPAERRAREAQERMAKMRGYASPEDEEEEELYASTETAGSSRRELLPDIEEINSTLRSNSDRSPDVDPGQTAQVEAREKKSSRKGFTLTVSLFALGTLTYVFAGQLSQSIPQLAPMLESYSALIDGARGWLDTQMSSLLVWLDETAANSSQ